MGAVGCRVMSVSGRKSNPRRPKTSKDKPKVEKMQKKGVNSIFEANSDENNFYYENCSYDNHRYGAIWEEDDYFGSIQKLGQLDNSFVQCPELHLLLSVQGSLFLILYMKQMCSYSQILTTLFKIFPWMIQRMTACFRSYFMNQF